MFPGVKTNTLVRILSPFWIGIAALCCAAKSPTAPAVIPQGDDTYAITRQAPNAFSRDTEKLKAEAEDDAAKYCAAQGKQLKVLSLTAKKPWFSTGYCEAKIVFKAVSPGEVETVAGGAAAVAPVEKVLTTDELYADLTKLDDLRKKGILTDEEFQLEKKKVLNRSK